ncbi:uncharacterized protein LOC132276223 [Cornus florida]|uniref:uncharacterized protein LOC132276223 n=1 Tax=Cornus florida TaxID=4283 RepID=UPI0028987C52|nr:uncharacterized protein LOC132276223 [Cornus florida]XP_059633545.1 uncharacterized protein LOC132276223 [Cornus florida]
MGTRVEKEETSPGNIGKKSKKNKKNVANSLEEAVDCIDVVPSKVEANVKSSKEDRRRKDKKKEEVWNDVQIDGTSDEAVNVKYCAKVDNTRQQEKDRRKKKKPPKLEAAEDNDTSNNVSHMEGEENRRVQTNGGKDSGHENLLKDRKDEKKRCKKVRKKGESDTVLSSMEILEDNNMRKVDAVNRQNSFEKEDVTEMKNDVVPSKEEGNVKSSKEDRRRKDKKKEEVWNDVQIDGTSDEAVNVKYYAEVDNTHQHDKDRRKKKKPPKFNAAEDNDTSNNVCHMEGEENRRVQSNGGKDSGHENLLKSRKDEKKRCEEDRKKGENDTVLSSMEILEDNDMRKVDVVNRQNSFEKEDVAEMKNRERRARKRNKRRRDMEDGDLKEHKKITDGKEVEKVREDFNEDIVEKVEKKKRKRKKKLDEDDLSAGFQEIVAKEHNNERTTVEDKDFVYSEGNTNSSRNKMVDKEMKNVNKEKRKKKLPDTVESSSKDPKSEGKSKKVRFSDHVEVFPLSDDPFTLNTKEQEDNLVRGKRFSLEEDEMVKEAVYNYIKVNNLGEEGLDMVLHCKDYPQIKNCWKEIGAALPHRPYVSIYYRAHILFERDEKRGWTPEEYEIIKKFHEVHGPDWKTLADELGKHRFHVKDTWRRIKLSSMKKGRWSQEECQNLFNLVNMDLRMKVFEEKYSKHGMLRDNICWSAISDKLSTRSNQTCCKKWYCQLTSPMVAEGEWADADDYRLLTALYSLDECCMEDVDWDNLIDHRSGDVCRKRWNQMVRQIGQPGNNLFAEQVEILSKRYCPDLLEPREIWDNKPVLP